MTEQVVAVTIIPATPVNATVTIGGEGPPGPTGPSGTGGDSHFVFTQAVASASWKIVHGLGKQPVVFVQDTANDEVEGDVEFVNTNELIITFSAPFSGIAYLN